MVLRPVVVHNVKANSDCLSLKVINAVLETSALLQMEPVMRMQPVVQLTTLESLVPLKERMVL
jgi:hypothetical protein